MDWPGFRRELAWKSRRQDQFRELQRLLWVPDNETRAQLEELQRLIWVPGSGQLSNKDDVEYQYPTFPSVSTEDVDGSEIPHLTTLSTASGLDAAVWAELPDALVDRVLTCLPPAAFARLRSVCKRWNELPSSPGWLRQSAEVTRRPSCTVMCELGVRVRFKSCFFTSALRRRHVPARTAFFFCHSERKWFGMPPLGHSQEAGAFNWEIVDVDWGLVCYACYEHSGLWLCVRNPLTKAETVLPPPFLGGWKGEYCPRISYNEFAKLVVDRQSKTYKIVVLMRSSRPRSTLMYDSATALWTVLQRGPARWTVLQNCRPHDPPDDRAGGCFLWKRTIFMPCGNRRVLQTFDVDAEVWREVTIETPRDSRHGMRYHFVSNFDSFLIIRSYHYLGPHKSTRPISVLTLNGDSASPLPLFRDHKWIEVDVRNRAYLHHMISVACRDNSHNDCLIFTNPHTKHWIMYTLRTRSWQEMPSRGKRFGQYAWYDWEPRWDVGTGPDPLPILKYCSPGG